MEKFKAFLIAISPIPTVGIIIGVPGIMYLKYDNPWGWYVLLGICAIFLLILLVLSIGVFYEQLRKGTYG